MAGNACALSEAELTDEVTSLALPRRCLGSVKLDAPGRPRLMLLDRLLILKPVGKMDAGDARGTADGSATGKGHDVARISRGGRSGINGFSSGAVATGTDVSASAGAWMRAASAL